MRRQSLPLYRYQNNDRSLGAVFFCAEVSMWQPVGFRGSSVFDSVVFDDVIARVAGSNPALAALLSTVEMAENAAELDFIAEHVSSEEAYEVLAHLVESMAGFGLTSSFYEIQ
jgi:hypothetical protein